MNKYMVHAEWKERVPGKLLLQHRERTVERYGKDFMKILRAAQREFPGARITLRSMEQKPPEIKA